MYCDISPRNQIQQKEIAKTSFTKRTTVTQDRVRIKHSIRCICLEISQRLPIWKDDFVCMALQGAYKRWRCRRLAF